MELKQDDIVELTAQKLVYSGAALSHIDGKVVFIENAVPGDKIKARILRINKNFIRAKIVEIIEPSSHRVKPFCPLFNACGGCNLQNVEYDFLISQKQGILEEMFSQNASEAFKNIEFKPFIRSEKLKEYRCKIQNTVSETKVSKRLLTGYYKENTHEVVNIKFCPIQPKVVDEITGFIRENWKFSGYVERTNKGLLKHVLIRFSNSSGKMLLTLVLNKDFEYFDKIKTEIEEFAKTLAEKFPVITGILVNFNPKKTNKITGDKTELIFGDDFVEEKLKSVSGEEYTYKISKDSFFQVNPKTAEKVFDAVKAFADKDSCILDAYGGVGAISIFLSNKAKKIILVEESESAVNDAKANFKANNCANYEVFLGDAKEIFKTLQKPVQKSGKTFERKYDLTILDPPRKGSDKEALEIISKLTKKIVYVSCNPATLARDAKILYDLGFKLKSLQGADMFPFTHHIESVACFEKLSNEK